MIQTRLQVLRLSARDDDDTIMYSRVTRKAFVAGQGGNAVAGMDDSVGFLP